MSTKIYQGFLLGTDNLHTVLDMVRDFRKGYWEKEAHEVWLKFAHLSLAEYKMQDAEAKSDVFKLWHHRRQDIKRTGRRDAVVDTDMQIVLFPYRDGQMLGIVYAERSSWFRQWCTLPGVREYWYWNNSDEPEGMTQKEWDTRREAWDEVLTGDDKTGVPSLEGFTIDIHDSYVNTAWE